MSAATSGASGPARPIETQGRWLVLAGAMLTAWVVRSLLFATIFLGDGFVLLGLDDSAYHARRALFSFANFPHVLLFDPYMAYPDGSPVPFPPLYDWLIAAVARLFGDSTEVFERVAAWAAVALATTTLLPVYGIGRLVRGPAVGLAAAWIYAVLPASSLLSSVGYLDHHAAVAFVATCWLWSSLRQLSDERAGRAGRVIAHALIVTAMPVVWSGSLLYVALAEGARFAVAGVFWRHPGRLMDQAASAGSAALLVVPWVAAAPTPIDGAFSSTALSWLHVVVLLALAALAAATSLLERRRPEPRWSRRVLRVLATALAIALPLLVIPGLAATLATALTFVSGQDVWAAGSPEQQPLFASTAEVLARSATVRFGWLVYGVPLLPVIVAAALRDRERREQLTLLLVWTTLLTVLALKQVRFAHDLAPLASVVFAGVLVGVSDGLARRVPRPLARVAGAALGVALLWPAISQVHLPRARFALGQLGATDQAEPARLSPWESEARFAVEVGRATPETSGFLDDRVRPEYALLVDPSLGHSFLYWSRRPVPANNFGQYLDREKFDLASLFYAEVDAARALDALDRLAPRFVVTAMDPYAPPLPYSQRLHRGDGFRGGDPVCGPCLRLVTEGPPGGTRRLMQGRGGYVAYKLFERVPGALVEVKASPGARVALELDLETPLGRRLVFEAEAQADADGRARLRLPYATDVQPPVHAVGVYRLRIDAGEAQPLELADEAVRAGATIVVDDATDNGDAAQAAASGPTPSGASASTASGAPAMIRP